MKIFKIYILMLLVLSGCTPSNNNKCEEKGCVLSIVGNYNFSTDN